MLEPLFTEETEFNYVLVQAADDSKLINGSNGNYDVYDIYLGDRLIRSGHPDCEWTRLGRDFFVDLDGCLVEIKNHMLWEDEKFYMNTDGLFVRQIDY